MSQQRKKEDILKKIADVPFWFHQIEIAPGIVTLGKDQTQEKLALLDRVGLPKDMTGMRVLDIGAWDGFFSFTAEKRGASEVIAMDNAGGQSGFAVAKELLDSKVTYHEETVYDISPEKLGHFDLVMFLGVFYHLRHPLLALDRIRSVMKTGGLMVMESHVIDHFVLLPDESGKNMVGDYPELQAVPLLQFYPRGALGGDWSNMFGPNLAGMRELAEEAQFEVIKSMVGAAPHWHTRGFLCAHAIEDDDRRYIQAREENVLPELYPEKIVDRDGKEFPLSDKIRRSRGSHKNQDLL